ADLRSFLTFNLRSLCLFGIIVAIFMILFSAPAKVLVAQNPPQTRTAEPACLSGAAHVSTQGKTGALRFVGTDSGRPSQHPRPQEAVGSAEAASRAYLAACGSLFDIQNQANELRLKGIPDVDSARTV